MRQETFGLTLTICALLACAGSSSTRIGRDTYSVECKRKRGNCYEEAARRCPHGFDVLDGSDHRGAVVVANQYSPNTATATVIPTYDGELLIRCQAPAPPPVAVAPTPAPEPKPAPKPWTDDTELPLGPQANPWDAPDAGSADE